MPDQNKSNILDLEALAPKAMQIKLPTGELVDVQPPKMQDTMRLSTLGQRMRKADELSDEELDTLNDDVNKAIVRMIPQLEGVTLATNQTLAIIQMLAEMGVPATQKDLADQGVTQTPGPNADSN